MTCLRFRDRCGVAEGAREEGGREELRDARVDTATAPKSGKGSRWVVDAVCGTGVPVFGIGVAACDLWVSKPRREKEFAKLESGVGRRSIGVPARGLKLSPKVNGRGELSGLTTDRWDK